MIDLGKMFYRLGVDTSGLKHGEKAVRDFSTTTKKHFSDVENYTGALKKAFVGIASALSVREVIRYATEWKGYNNILRNATRESGDFLKIQRQIFNISQDNGAALRENAKLFQAVSRLKPEIGATNEEVLKFVDLINKLGTIGGSSTTEMGFALRQLQQGLAGGVLRAEEFNSIIENTPEIANRIAKGMGLTVGQLRLMVIDGKVLSKDIFETILKQSDEITQQAGEMGVTLDRAWTTVKNSATKFFGEIDEGLGATTLLSESILSFGQYLGSRDVYGAAVDLKLEVLEIGDALFTLIEPAAEIGSMFADALPEAQTMGGFIEEIFEDVKGLPEAIRSAFELAAVDIISWWKEIEHIIAELEIGFKTLWEIVKNFGIEAAIAVGQKFAEILDTVLNTIASTIDLVEEGMKTIPFVDVDFGNASKSIRDAARFEESILKVKEEVNREHENKLRLLGQELDGIERVHQAEMDALAEEKAELAFASDEREKARIEKAEQRKLEADQAKQARQNELEASKQHIEALKAVSGDSGSGSGGGGGKGGSKVDAARRQAESRLKILESSLMTELELENQSYEESLASLKEAEQLKLDSILPYQELRERLEEDHLKRLRELNMEHGEEMKSIVAATELLGLKYTEALGEDKVQLRQQLFKEEIAAAARYSKEFFQLQKALAIAGIAIDTPKAIASAYRGGLELSGGNVVVAGIFAAIAGAAMAAQAAGIASAQYRGGRELGGSVTQGGLYEVGERGRPELLEQNGKFFLVPGNQGGEVHPASSGSTPQFNVIVNNNAPNVDVRTVQRGRDLELIIEQVEAKLTNDLLTQRGNVSQALTQSFDIKRRGA